MSEEELGRGLTTEQLDRLQFGRSLHTRPTRDVVQEWKERAHKDCQCFFCDWGKEAVAEIENARSQLEKAHEALHGLHGDITSKLTQLRLYRDNECQLDHARTIADGRILQAEQILPWVNELITSLTDEIKK